MRFAILLMALCVGPLRADGLSDKIDEVVNRPDYKQARWGISIVDAKSGKAIYERNPEQLFIPASTTKLFSCAAALAAYGADYRFTTPLYQRGPVKDGVLRGDLILVASGDLTFGGRVGKNGKTVFVDNDHVYANSGLGEAAVTDTDPLYAIDELARQVAKAGIKEVSGEIMVDDRLFNRARGTGSGPDLISPMIVNDNLIDILVKPAKEQDRPAEVQMRPSSSYYQMDAEVMTVANGKATKLVLQSTGPTQFSVRGEIAVDAKPIVRIYNVDEPVLFARALLIEALRRQGVHCAASLFRPARFDVPTTDEYEKLKKVGCFVSAPFSEAIAVTLKVSHNLYASTLPLLVAAKRGEQTLESGLRRQREFLKSLGVPVETISFSSGAGGGSADAVTPRAAVKLLEAMLQRPEADAYFDGLPVLGVDGTLATAIASDSPAKGKARAKTGTLIYYDSMNERMLLRSKALAGTIETAKGTKLCFAMFVNEVPLPRGVAATREGKVLGKLCEIIYQNGP